MSPFIPLLSGLLISQCIRSFPFLIILLFFLASLYLILKKRVLIIFLTLIGILYGHMRYEGVIRIEEIEGSPLEVLFLSKEYLSNQIYKGEIISAKGNFNEIVALRGKEATLISPDELETDRIYKLTARVSSSRIRKNPGSYNDGAINLLLISRDSDVVKVHGPFHFLSKCINDKRNSLDGYLKRDSSDSGIFLSSIITGKRTGMSREVKDSFSRTGLAHILSISGTHFGLLATFVFFVIRAFISLLPHPLLRRLTIYLTPSQVSAILSLPFLILYLLISGASIPAIRSFIMINMFLLGLLINRKGYWLNSLLFAAFLILTWNPSYLKDISFQLSFLAALFLGFSLKGINHLKHKDERGLKGLLKNLYQRLSRAFTMSLFAALGTTPIVAYYFHYISIISPIMNITLTPLICLILLPLALSSSFIFILTGYFPFESLIFSLTNITLKAIKSLSSLSFSSLLTGDIPLALIIAFYVITIAFIFREEGKPNNETFCKLTVKRIFLLSLLTTSLLIVLLPRILYVGLSITFLDVGQGDCTVIETKDGRVFVVDTGKTGVEVESYLLFRGKDTIEAIIITHADKDHSGGLLRLLKRFKVKEIWDNGFILYPEVIATPIRHLERGDLIKTGDLEMLILHPYKGFYSTHDRGDNDYSLVIKLKGKRWLSLLLTADAEGEAEEDLLYLNGWLRSKVIKIAHHGSRYSSTESFLDSVSPEIAIVSVGRENPFGHPHEETLERLKILNTRIYRTDRVGAIKLTETRGGIAVKTYNDFIFERAKGPMSEFRNLKRIFQVW